MAENPNGDVERIYALIELLKLGQAARFLDSDDAWEVSFHGNASLRQANRISKFREFLAAQLNEDVKVAAAKVGSVVIEYATEPRSSYRSHDLMKQRDLLRAVAMELGIKSIRYAGEEITFDGTGSEALALAGPPKR